MAAAPPQQQQQQQQQQLLRQLIDSVRPEWFAPAQAPPPLRSGYTGVSQRCAVAWQEAQLETSSELQDRHQQLWTRSTRFRLPLASHAVLQAFGFLPPQPEDLARVAAAHAAHQRQTVLDFTPGYGKCCCLRYHSATFSGRHLSAGRDPTRLIGAASAVSPRQCRRSSRRRHRSSHSSSSRRCRRRMPSSRRLRRHLMQRSTRLQQSSSRVSSRAWRRARRSGCTIGMRQCSACSGPSGVSGGSTPSSTTPSPPASTRTTGGRSWLGCLRGSSSFLRQRQPQPAQPVGSSSGRPVGFVLPSAVLLLIPQQPQGRSSSSSSRNGANGAHLR